MFTRFSAHGSAEEGTEDLVNLVRGKMFLPSCRPASVLPDNKVAITEQSQEGVIFALQSTGSKEMCLSLENQNPSKTSEKMGYFDRVTVSLHIL